MDPITPAITTNLMTQYGLAGFVVVVCLLGLIYVVKDLLKKSDKKDDQIIEIGKRFAESLDANTKAMHSLNESEIKLAAATDAFQKWLVGAKEDNEKAHSQILEFIRHRSARTG